MNVQEIEQKVREIDVDAGFDYVYELLRAYGIRNASVSRLKNGTYNKAGCDNEVLWKGKVYYHFVDCGDSLYSTIDDAKRNEQISKERPRFLIVRSSEQLLALDTLTEQTLDISVDELVSHFAFFLPWAGIEKTQLDNVSYADIKAAEKMAKLYDEIVKNNTIEAEEQIHDLNVFFSRLLFCFFAEDTGVFERRSFTNAVGSFTGPTGADLHTFFDELFQVLNTPTDSREGVPVHLKEFGYVNGKLFERRVSAPRFTAKAREAVLECGTLDWSQINPDIFGSMIQVVVHPSQRERLGMHYTSVENIMKVVRPLFLDEVQEAFDNAYDSPKRLQTLLDRICAIRIFDPASGSGNFLIISYKELRQLEHRILQRIAELDPKQRGLGLFKLSGIKLENFYGIEIDDFAHEIAILSLWLAKHQMNVEFEELFGAEIPLIPLKDSGNIVCGNATRVKWTDACPADTRSETFICSNPPYLGSRNQTPEQKADLALHHDRYKSLDYVCSWVILAAQMVREGTATAAGLVTTNSITQGDQVGILWPDIISDGVVMNFAHQSFRWTNEARGKAGVTCVIVGLRCEAKAKKLLYSEGAVRLVDNISPYMTRGSNVVVTRSSTALSTDLPAMTYGCLLNDGGNLILDSLQKTSLIQQCPGAEQFIKPFVGSREFLRGIERWCLFIEDSELESARSCPEIAARLEAVTEHRRKSSEKSTRRLADSPNRFYFSCYRDTQPIIVPRVSSARREYIPIGFLDGDTVISDLANAIYDAEPWVFGLIQSRMHMVWVCAVAGRLKTDFRYSAVLVYNTFPLPDLSDTSKETLAKCAFEVLGAREQFPDKTLSELYDPDKMPGGLRRAHKSLDVAFDRLYLKREFESDEERLELLFEMYEAITTDKELAGNA